MDADPPWILAEASPRLVLRRICNVPQRRYPCRQVRIHPHQSFVEKLRRAMAFHCATTSQKCDYPTVLAIWDCAAKSPNHELVPRVNSDILQENYYAGKLAGVFN